VTGCKLILQAAVSSREWTKKVHEVTGGATPALGKEENTAVKYTDKYHIQRFNDHVSSEPIDE